MTKCDGCGQESGNLYCGKCRMKMLKRHDLIPVLYYDKNKKGYRAGCTVLDCPANENGVCIVVHATLFSIKNITSSSRFAVNLKFSEVILGIMTSEKQAKQQRKFKGCAKKCKEVKNRHGKTYRACMKVCLKK